MNEFSAQTGGRYVYVDDVLNLQDLALAFGRIFDGCDNFIISGCEVSGTTISSGYVYLNNRIRYFSGASNITTWPQYLYEKNSTESVNYVSGGAKVGRNIYGVSIGSSMPTTYDPLTGKTPTSISVAKNGGLTMKDAFFGKYALILNPANLSQILNGSLKIDGDLEVTGIVNNTKNKYRITENQAIFDMLFDNGRLLLKTQYETGNNTYVMSAENNVGFVAYVNNAAITTIASDGVSVSGSVKATLGVFGNVGASSDGIYNHTNATNNGTVNINMVGYNGKNQYFRNTVIGNGKGTAVVTVNGLSNTVNIAGITTIASGASGEGIILSLNKEKTSSNIQKTILWKDSNKYTMGYVGFTESSESSFRVGSNIAEVYVYGAANSFVDLGPSIKENGQMLADKYLQISDFNAKLNNVSDGFNSAMSKLGGEVSKVKDGFSGYISAGNTQAMLREQIAAAGSADLDGCAKKSELLSDMATTDDIKRQICSNIGAAYANDYQKKTKDSGWVQILSTGLYIRQIGNIVSIQGKLKTTKQGTTVFTIPNSIDPPTYDVCKTLVLDRTYATDSWMSDMIWVTLIQGNTRNCKVTNYSYGVSRTIPFSLTYMV